MTDLQPAPQGIAPDVRSRGVVSAEAPIGPAAVAQRDFKVHGANGEPTPGPTRLQRVARKAVVSRLRRIRRGRLELHEAWVADGSPAIVVGKPEWDLDTVVVRILSPAFWIQMARGGSIGAGEAWMDGLWETDDLAGVVRVMVRNRDALAAVDSGWIRLVRPVRQLWNRLRANTLKGSRRNIAAHYDLGNDFFRLFLDQTLTYSSAVFEYPGQPLREASLAKLDRLCRKLDLRPGDHLLEIGTGWGSMAIHAAAHYGCKVTTTTISQEQYQLAVERVALAGLADRVTVLQEDYRDLEGAYDKLVSVEMIEAVGHQYLSTYMAKLCTLLKPNGLAALQVIHIADQHYERARKDVDFIKRYIFPGSFIPSITAVQQALSKHTDFRLVDLEEIGLHYAETLRRWRAACEERRTDILALGLPESFHRMWLYYLAYCEGGFQERFLGTAQLLFARPDASPWDAAQGLPSSRAWDPSAPGKYLWPL